VLSKELLSDECESEGVKVPSLREEDVFGRKGIRLKPFVKLPAGDGASL
jgi:hypothetical protein